MSGVPSIERAADRPRRPLIGLAAAFAAGCALATAVPDLPTGALATAAAVLLAAGAAFARRAAATAPLLAAALLVGGLHGALARPGRAPRDLANTMERDREYLRVSGRISSAPVFHPAAETGGAAEWRFELRLDSANRSSSEWRRARGTLAVRLRSAAGDPAPRYGEAAALSGVVRRAPDTRGALPMFARSETYRRLSAAPPSWRGHCIDARAAAARVLARGIDAYPVEAALVRALILGLREDIPESARERFLQTGTMHVFAISGLHVGILAGFGFALLRALGVPRRFEILGLAPLLALYVTATGLASSAVRAATMALAYAAAPLFGRRPDVRSAFALAAVAILAADPAQVRDLGFLYSFTVVAGLFVFGPPLARPLQAWFAPDPAAAEPRPLAARAARAAARWFAMLCALSAAAWLASAPLSARFGNLFTPGALAGNLVALPAASAIGLTGGLSLVAGAVHGPLAEVFNHANRVFAAALVFAMDRLAAVPGAHRHVAAPPVWAMAAAYVATAGLLWLRGRPRRALAGAAAAVVAAAAAHTALDRRVTVHVLDEARGGAVLLEGPRAPTVLVDAGPRHRAARLARFLRSRGVNRIDVLVLSRADADRAGGAPELAARFPVARALHPAAAARSPVFTDALARLRAAGVRVEPFGRGDRTSLPDGAELEAFHPAPGARYPRTDEAALVVRWGRDGAALLVVPSGTAAAPFAALADSGFDSPAPAVVVAAPLAPAHRAALCAAVRPRLVALRGAPADTAAAAADGVAAGGAIRWLDANGEAGAGWTFGPPPLRRGPSGAISVGAPTAPR